MKTTSTQTIRELALLAIELFKKHPNYRFTPEKLGEELNISENKARNVLQEVKKIMRKLGGMFLTNKRKKGYILSDDYEECRNEVLKDLRRNLGSIKSAFYDFSLLKNIFKIDTDDTEDTIVIMERWVSLHDEIEKLYDSIKPEELKTLIDSEVKYELEEEDEDDSERY